MQYQVMDSSPLPLLLPPLVDFTLTFPGLGGRCSPAPSPGQAYIAQCPGTIKACYVIPLDLFRRARRYNIDSYGATYRNGQYVSNSEQNSEKRNLFKERIRAEKGIVRSRPRDKGKRKAVKGGKGGGVVLKHPG